MNINTSIVNKIGFFRTRDVKLIEVALLVLEDTF